MTKFIKLTEYDGNLIVLNTDRIEHLTLGAKGSDTYIKLINNSGKLSDAQTKENYFFVKETVEEIYWKLTIDNTKAPVLMTAVEAIEYYKLKDGV